jgi:hypothetical protein
MRILKTKHMKEENETAIDQLLGEYVKLYPDLFENPTHETVRILNLIVKYKCVEKQQIKDAWEDGQGSFSTRNAEQYYNETFLK